MESRVHVRIMLGKELVGAGRQLVFALFSCFRVLWKPELRGLEWGSGCGTARAGAGAPRESGRLSKAGHVP